MSKIEISDAVRYIGCDDHSIDLFESQYKVPNGVSYNSYVIIDEKIAIIQIQGKIQLFYALQHEIIRFKRVV